MEPRGRERHRWANRQVENGREHMSQSTDDERRVVGPGDAILIPSGTSHTIMATEPLRFLCCCAPLIRTRIRIWSNWLGTISAESSKKGRAVAAESRAARHINQKRRQRKPKTVAAVSDCRGQSVACLLSLPAVVGEEFRSWG